MNPYDRTAQEMKRQAEGPKRALKAGVGIGATLGATSFAPVLGRVAPLLSQYIPQDLAIKGLSKISPQIGKFVKDAMESGYDFDEVKNFMGEKVQESAKSDKNIIQQESPELHQFLDQEIKKGRNPIEAGALAQNDKRFSKIIEKLMKSHKTPWSSIIQSIFGGGETAQPQQQQVEQEPQIAQVAQGGQQQPGQGQQALMAILQKINQKIGQ